MRGGLIISVAFHAALLVALVIGLPFFDSAPKQALPPIPVEVVRLSDATSTPKGAKPQPKTDKTPDADKTTAKEPARRDPKAGDKGKAAETKKAEPRPEPKQPEAKPEPKPEPKRADVTPEKKPAPKAKPERVEAAPTPRKAEPKPEKKQVAEATPPKTKAETPKEDETKPEPKRTRVAARPQVRPKPPREVARKPEAKPERKPEPEKQEARKKRGDVKSMDSVFKTVNQFKRQTRETDKEDQTARPRPVGREDATKSAPLTISEIDAIRRQIQPCWNFPAGAANPENLRVMVRLRLRPDGSLISAEVRDRSRMASDSYYRAAAEAALRAVRNPQCSPLRLPAAKYDQWKSLTLEFDPAKLKAG